jgi:hypothetical protein
MVDTVRTVGPLQAPNDRGSPHLEWSVQSLRFRLFRAACVIVGQSA